MYFSSPDSEKYRKAVEDLAHLIKTFGSKEILLDLHRYFPEQYEDMVAVLQRGLKTKQLARLLDADQGRCSRTRMEDSDLVIERLSGT